MFLQVATEAVPVSNPILTNQIDAIMHQIGLVGVTVYIIQFLKQSKYFPAISADTEQLTSVLSTVVAGVAAILVQGSITIHGDSSTGWNGTFSIPAMHTMWDCFLRFVAQKMGQEVVYQKVVKRPQEVAVVPKEHFDLEGKPIIELK